MRISYSLLETFKNCPLKFKYQEIDKIKAAKSIEAIFGGTIHLALKKIFERTPLYPTLDEIINFFHNLWEERIEKNSKLNNQQEEISPETKKIYLEEGIKMLKNFYKSNPPWNFNVVELESRFEVIIEDPSKKEHHILVGIIDRIDKNPDEDTYEIIDYKTAKRMPSQADINKDLQLSIYNLGLLKRWPHLNPERIKLSLYFLKHNEKIETKRSLAELEETKKEILKTINQIQELIKNNKEFIPIPSPLCEWCGYKNICPMWRHLYQKKPTPDQKEIEEIIEEYFSLKDQNKANNQRINELQAQINEFMDQEGIKRVFGKTGYITKVFQERISYDMEKIKKILQELGKWDEVVKRKQYPTFQATKKKLSKENKNN